MRPIRLIARLDIKGPNLIKGIHLEGLRVIGDPQLYAQRYYEQGIDEIIYMDSVASLYGRNNLTEILEHTARHVFVPITVGGGVRSVEDARKLLRSGADKVAINTAAIARPPLLKEIAEEFGSQAVVLSVEAKRLGKGGWEAYTDNGREHTGRDAIEWIGEAEELGAGELLLTSIDQEGTRKGFDIDLVRSVADRVSIPVIASGGMGSVDDLAKAVSLGHADAIAMADILHYDRMTVAEIRDQALALEIPIREIAEP
ncbi:MAG: imidazole glycerol phosphate synthase subunit HisF [Nisaea sp.]|uniref:imidazole glycerol phosphate synthase subunit HisF n=1 Tax=Nisaea sp. TaxID=2024842 RepID=UPI001B07E268|nr:imidazole glycerol phosphate synthase cyclase subunit [Nisaea sp.]MBO6562252.1 imidazole glycerol phosphate synthase subunit HisF [Nisaea sp.]